jgi:branched-subunit amino acid transport protein
MIDIYHILCIFGLAVITLITRSFFFISERAWELPNWAKRGLQFAPIAALSASVSPEIFMQQGQLSDLAHDARIYAVFFAIGFFILKRGKGQVVLGTILVGMMIYLPLHLGMGWS